MREKAVHSRGNYNWAMDAACWGWKPRVVPAARVGAAGREAAGAGRCGAGGAGSRREARAPPRGQSRPAPVGGRGSRRGRAATRRRKGRARGTWSTLTRTHGLLQLRQEAHTGASVMDGGLEAAPRMARLGRAPARDLGVAARGGIRAATGGGRCGFFPLFLAPFSVTRAAGGQ